MIRPVWLPRRANAAPDPLERTTRPRLFKLVLWLVALAPILGVLAFLLQPFGNRGPMLAVVAGAGVLVWWLGGRIRIPALRREARPALVALLLGWFVLLSVSALRPGGSPPPSKQRDKAVRLVTWNILKGRAHAPLWSGHDWPRRRQALRTALQETEPEILCVQEALIEQVRFLEALFPGFERVGVGRDDGRNAGEFCAIFYNKDRFTSLDHGTFWLENPTDQPIKHGGMGPKRICTWVRLRDRKTNSKILVLNTHSYLTIPAQRVAVETIARHLSAVDPSDLVILAGDLNAAPDAPCRQDLKRLGLVDQMALQHRSHEPTYQFYGLGMRQLDAVFTSPRCRVDLLRVLDRKPDNTYPSDHFGLLADIRLPRAHSGR